ncbi:hypothetical protein DSCW_18410 [Desulfosarcina widdelii]|uniref:Uncharacterized protein n=1 Tax=Desulfosarcina widdelii TaxID=947919 RepID=A0A5K7Z7H2_9BACT|nr:hypothetical protein [Desulfosarcina widdelii]BBO74424.1 hypothetical protein DSCW_18410 [Desulfosarcina widdelii]
MDKSQRTMLEYDLKKIIVEVAESAQEGEIVWAPPPIHEEFEFYERPDDLADRAVKRLLAAIDENQLR